MNTVKSRRAAMAQLGRNSLALALLVALSAHAQDQGSAEKSKDEAKKEVTELKTLVVTGTHKAGLSPTESISPLMCIAAPRLKTRAPSI